ncbi:MAG: PhoH family protein, partial [Erysipelotrichaceae bacterium]|nr:PhoH family protein [Erysipelotrichaceae bacterium]
MGLAGFHDENLQVLERELQVKLYLKNDVIRIEAENQRLVDKTVDALQQCLDSLLSRGHLDKEETGRIALGILKDAPLFVSEGQAPVLRCKNGKLIYPKTANQAALVEAFRTNEIVFASGVAGTGKTYLAVAYAVDQLKRENISKIILTRPAVEAGENLGFLPGDMKEKVDPYLRPLYDALNEMLGQETVERYIEKEVIEIAPLAFMRGRTLNEAIVILDEAQNTTRSQMKMFLTRMGKQCKMFING